MGYRNLAMGQQKKIALVAHDNKKHELFDGQGSTEISWLTTSYIQQERPANCWSRNSDSKLSNSEAVR